MSEDTKTVIYCFSLTAVNLLSSSILQAFTTPVVTGLGSAGKIWETLRRSSQNLADFGLTAHALWSNPKYCFFYIYSIAKVLCCFGIRTEEIQLTALKNFQGSKALVVAAEKIPLNVPNHRFETWSLHMLDSWLSICVDYFTRRYKVKPEWLVKINQERIKGTEKASSVHILFHR